MKFLANKDHITMKHRQSKDIRAIYRLFKEFGEICEVKLTAFLVICESRP